MQRSINWLIGYYLTVSSASSISTIFTTRTSSITCTNCIHNYKIREGNDFWIPLQKHEELGLDEQFGIV